MEPYVDVSEQLVVEIYVRDLERALELYLALGFLLARRDIGFAELAWENSRLMLAAVRGLPEPAPVPRCSLRVMVPDVDRYVRRCGELGLLLSQPIGDRDYGLRDFTVVTPDGIALRFASRLSAAPALDTPGQP